MRRVVVQLFIGKIASIDAPIPNHNGTNIDCVQRAKYVDQSEQITKFAIHDEAKRATAMLNGQK